MLSIYIKIVYIILFVFIDILAQSPIPVGPVPNARQLEWYHREVIAFFHFGINTFGDNVNEGDGKASPKIFNPTQLDCMQWMTVLKSAGISCGIFVAKHADGFCNWPSAFTDYSVKNSPWKNGKGDGWDGRGSSFTDSTTSLSYVYIVDFKFRPQPL